MGTSLGSTGDVLQQILCQGHAVLQCQTAGKAHGQSPGKPGIVEFPGNSPVAKPALPDGRKLIPHDRAEFQDDCHGSQHQQRSKQNRKGCFQQLTGIEQSCRRTRQPGSQGCINPVEHRQHLHQQHAQHQQHQNQHHGRIGNRTADLTKGTLPFFVIGCQTVQCILQTASFLTDGHHGSDMLRKTAALIYGLGQGQSLVQGFSQGVQQLLQRRLLLLGQQERTVCHTDAAVKQQGKAPQNMGKLRIGQCHSRSSSLI